MAERTPDNKYGLLPADLVSFLKDCEHRYFSRDLPVPFCGLSVYPATVKDYEEFSACSGCLTLNKNEDPKGIAMSHLGYLVGKTQIKENDEGRVWSYKIQRLFEIVFHVKNGLKCDDCGETIPYDGGAFAEFIKKVKAYSAAAKEEGAQIGDPPKLVCPHCGKDHISEMMKFKQDPKTRRWSLSIDGKTLSDADFTKLRQIVLYQNFPDYADDSWVDPAIKKDHDEKMRMEARKNNLHATIEKKVVCLSIATTYRFDEIWDMPIRKFTMAVATVDDLINYKIMKQATMSGFVSLPKGKTVEHWIYKPDKDMYGDTYKDLDQVKSQASGL